MKQTFTYLVLCAALLGCAAGCSNENGITGGDETHPAGIPLTIRATAEGFAPADGVDTRTGDDGYKTTFTTGDQIGVFAVRANGTPITDTRNVPYTLQSDGSWSGEAYYYEGAKYFAYYPYNGALGESINTLDGIVSGFSPQADQSTYALYAKNDLMTADALAPDADKKLSFVFRHRMSLVEVALPPVICKFTNTSPAVPNYEIPAEIPGATFNIGSQTGAKPYYAGDGIYRYIVSGTASSIAVNGQFPDDGKTVRYEKTALALAAGKYSRLNVDYTMSPISHLLQIGDFYMKDGTLKGKDESLTAEDVANCIGIVFWIGDATQYDEKQLKVDHPKCTHGLVVAAGEEKCYWMEDINAGASDVLNWFNANIKDDFLPISPAAASDMRNIQGYNNTKAIEMYNENNTEKVIPIQKTVAYRKTVPAPSISSDWYFTSSGDWFVCCGVPIGSTLTNTVDNLDLLNTQLNKIGGTEIIYKSETQYWTNTIATFPPYVAYISSTSVGFSYYISMAEPRKIRFTLAF